MIESWLKVLIQNGPIFFPDSKTSLKKDCDEKKKNAKNQTQDVFCLLLKKQQNGVSGSIGRLKKSRRRDFGFRQISSISVGRLPALMPPEKKFGMEVEGKHLILKR